jgi:glucokinase
MTSLMRVLEVGGTHVTAATVDTARQEVRERTRRGLDSSATAVTILGTLRDAAMTLADTVPTRWAVAMPDPFDYVRGIALFRDVGKFDALYGVDVGRALTDAITPAPRSITFAHDTEAFLLGEWLCGAARGTRRCVAVTVGTGIGSAFLAHGRTVRDGPGLPPDGRIHRLCVDGFPLEDVVSRRAIRAHYAARSGSDRDLDVHEIAGLARNGDPIAAIVLDEAFTALGRALAPAVCAFAPERIVVGGSVARSWDLLARPLEAGLRAGGAPGVEIRPALREADAAVIGAARHASTPRPQLSTDRAATARTAIAHALADAGLVDRLTAYYAPRSTSCGVNFLDGTECRDEATVTGVDLFAVTNLGLDVPPAVARCLLGDTAEFARIAHLLAADRLPTGVALDAASPAILAAMRDLHEAMLAATDGDALLASAICARKRPDLFPVLDAAVLRHLHLSDASAATCWHTLRAVLRDAGSPARLAAPFETVRARGLAVDVYPLRQLHVLAETASAID